MGTIANPLASVIDGLLKGHELGLQMDREKRSQQEFMTQQAMHNQQMSMQDIMNRQFLQENARPVDDTGAVTSPAGPDVPNTAPGMPASPGAPAYVRKADSSRTVKYGGRQYEFKTPEEQDQAKLEQQTRGMDALQAAKDRAAINSAQALHQNQLKLEGGGTPAQGLAMMGVPDGTLLTRDELSHYTQGLTAHLQSQQALEKGDQVLIGPGQQLLQRGTAPGPAAAVPSAAAPGQPTIPMEPMNVPGVPAAAPSVGTPAPGAPPLANNPTVQRMRVIASGGPANPTGPRAEFENEFLPGYYQEKGITNPQPKDRMAAYLDFLKRKPEDVMTEVGLAQRAARGDREAEAALKRLDQSKLASRPVTNVTLPGLGPGTAGAANPQLTGEEFLKTLPAGTAAQVRAIFEGRAMMPSASSRAQGAMALRDAVFRADPSYSDQRAQVRKAFTTGKDGTNIGNLNTAAVHLDQMAEAAKAMNNGTWQPGNQLYNYIATKLGSSAPTNYQAVMNAFAGEAANALKGSATDPEIAHVMSTLGANMSPQQAAGVATTNLHTLGAKLNTYQERYNQQIPNDTVWSPVLPSTRAVFQKYGIDGGGGRGPVGPIGGGVTPKAPAVGTVEGGYRFKGGDPAQPTSWERVR